MALLDEQIEGKYEILEKIREGGMGAIYKVRHRLLDEVRIVKAIRSHGAPSAEASDRFLAEARVAIRLRHPNVALLHDFSVGSDGNGFIVMEFIEGWSLLEVLQGYGPPPLPLTLEIARQSLRALGYLHRQRIVHRDVSPDNLMLTRDVEGQPLVKLIDLGIAKTLETGESGLTATGIFLGKPRYAPPERLTGESCDARSDLYSFGVMLYELLTGRSPLRGVDVTSIMAAHLLQPPLDFAESDPRGLVPDDVRQIVLRTLAKKPAERTASAEELACELAAVQSRFPLAPRDLQAVVDVLLPFGTGRTTGIHVLQEGSTQERLDREFLLDSLPPDTVPQPSPAVLRAVPPAEALEPTQPVTVRLAHAPAVAEETTRTPAGAEGSVLDDLTWITHGPPRTFAANPPPSPAEAPPALPSPRRRVLWASLAALVALFAIGLTVWLALGSRRPAEEARPAALHEVTATPRGAVTREGDVPSTPAPATPTPAPSPVVSPSPLSAGAAPPSPSREPAGKTTGRKVRAIDVVPPGAGEGDWLLPGPGVEPPVPLTLPSYEYPAAARGIGRKVKVRLSVLVEADGKVSDVRVREGDGSALGFDEAALDAARRTVFQPATRDGVPGRMWTELLLTFEE